MKEKFLFVPSLVSTIVFFIIKLILNNRGLEFMSYIYYLFIFINFIYIIISSLYLFKKDKELKILIEVIMFLIIFCSTKLIIGNDVRVNKNIVQTKYITVLQNPKYGYRYVNYFVRGNEKIECILELCKYKK